MDAAEFLERTTVRELLNVAPGVVDHGRRIAHQLYRAGRLAKAEVVCRGLIACDHRFAWTYSLHAAVLRRQGRLQEALGQVLRGLGYEPGHATLQSMRVELTALLLPRPGRPATTGPVVSSTLPAPLPLPMAATVHDRGPQRASGRTDSDL